MNSYFADPHVSKDTRLQFQDHCLSASLVTAFDTVSCIPGVRLKPSVKSAFSARLPSWHLSLQWLYWLYRLMWKRKAFPFTMLKHVVCLFQQSDPLFTEQLNIHELQTCASPRPQDTECYLACRRTQITSVHFTKTRRSQNPMCLRKHLVCHSVHVYTCRQIQTRGNTVCPTVSTANHWNIYQGRHPVEYRSW